MEKNTNQSAAGNQGRRVDLTYYLWGISLITWFLLIVLFSYLPVGIEMQ